MSEDRSPGAWFAPKTYGYGATPVTWQGWAVTLVFVVVVMATTALMVPHQASHVDGAALLRHGRRDGPLGLRDQLALFGMLIAEAAAFLVIVRWKSSGPWVWRWGQNR